LVQLEHAYFPVAETELSAALEYVDLTPGKPCSLGDAIVTPVLMNHPVTCLGYRIDADESSVFFTGDHEPPYNIYEPGDPDFAGYQDLLDERIAMLEDAIRGVDVLICDATYLESEYEAHKGWGHSSTAQCLRLAERVGAGTLVLTHHEPTRDDASLDALAEHLEASQASRSFDVIIAREGMIIEVTKNSGEPT
jgi:ribonuclease BN (tRNA processing enzyme)